MRRHFDGMRRARGTSKMPDDMQRDITLDMILDKVRSYQADADIEKIKKAYAYA